jgi:hypothetical protein
LARDLQMARYFFNINGVRLSLDEEGEELPDDEAAWQEATIIAGELFKHIDGKFRPGEDWALEVTDDQRKPLYTIQISARVTK